MIKKATIISSVCAATLCTAGSASAANILLNPGFDDGTIAGGNNLAAAVANWTTDSANGFNAVGSQAGYGGGPDTAQSGSNYIDLHGNSNIGADNIWQTFTIAVASDVTFSAYFSNREFASGENASSRQITVGIFDATGTTLQGSSVSLDLGGDAMPSTSWTQTATGSVTNLAAGTYRFNANMGALTNIDTAFVEATAVPEPSSTALIGLGGLALIMRRRK